MTMTEEGIRTLVALGHALRPRPLDLSPMVTLGRALIQEEEQPLLRFLTSFAERPDWHRAYWLGQTALARSRLPPIQRRGIDILGADPDLFGPSGDRHDEVTHTKTITWALQRPELALGCREALFKLLEARGRPHHGAVRYERAGLDPSAFTARSEVVLEGYGRVDVWLESQSEVVVIEAKLMAGEGADQTHRYQQAEAKFSRGRRWTVVFLTLDEEQEPEGASVQLSFRGLLAAWLPVAAGGTTTAHEHLARYLATLGRITGAGRAGSFDDWTFTERRLAVELVTGSGDL
jgi:hypothetical protein